MFPPPYYRGASFRAHPSHHTHTLFFVRINCGFCENAPRCATHALRRGIRQAFSNWSCFPQCPPPPRSLFAAGRRDRRWGFDGFSVGPDGSSITCISREISSLCAFPLSKAYNCWHSLTRCRMQHFPRRSPFDGRFRTSPSGLNWELFGLGIKRKGPIHSRDH